MRYFTAQLKKSLQLLIAVCSIALAGLPLPASAFVLQTANNTSGNQGYSGVGVRFTVNSSIDVSQLGIYDSGQDGISAGTTLWASLFSANTWPTGGILLASQSFTSASPGTLSADYLFKAITPLTLLPGDYVLAGYGWVLASDPENNCIISGACETFNNGLGLLTYFGSVYGGGTDAPTVMPYQASPGNPNYFSAANMVFAATAPAAPGPAPEPATLALLGIGLAGLGFGRRKLQA